MKLAIIPARGGSKRIPRKNIKLFAGKPMISYAIEAALACGEFDRVIVTTDDQEIAEVANDYGAALPFRRPAELADDYTPTVPVIQHAILACEALGWHATHICCIYPGVPFIKSEDLTSALDLLEAYGGEGYTFPVTCFPSPIQRALKRDEAGRVGPFNPQFVSTRTQDLEPAYYDAGQFYWGRKQAWLSALNIHANGRSIILPEWRAIDIDTPEDWKRAEAMYRAVAQMPNP